MAARHFARAVVRVWRSRSGSCLPSEMLGRYLWIALVVVDAAELGACGKDDNQQQATLQPAVAESAPSSKQPAAVPGPPAPGPATAMQVAGSNGPKDRPVPISNDGDMTEIERAVAPYVEQARNTYPQAKRRYLAGLPRGYHFSVVTMLHSPERVEVVFVAVTRINGNRVTGRIDSNILSVAGYKAGDVYTFSEAELVDWVIVGPDGKEEGNVVGKFLDTWKTPQR